MWAAKGTVCCWVHAVTCAVGCDANRVPQDTIGRAGDFAAVKIIVPVLSSLTVTIPPVVSRRRGQLSDVESNTGFPLDQVRSLCSPPCPNEWRCRCPVLQ